MRTLLWRLGGPGIVALVGLAFELLGDFPGSRALGYIALVTAVVWTVYLGWPLLKRWRPLTLAPATSSSTQATDKEFQQARTPSVEQRSSESSRELAQFRWKDKQLEEQNAKLKLEKRALKEQLEQSQSSGRQVFAFAAVTQEIPEDMVSARRIRGLSFRLMELIELAGENAKLSGWRFDRCTIIGPAVVTFTGRTDINGVGVESDSESTLYEVDSNDKIGIIRLDNCTLRQCIFSGIGIVGTPGDQQWLRDTFSFR